MSESFDGAIAFAQALMADCDMPLLDRLIMTHDHDMEMADKSAYHRGYEDGRRSMDAEHYAVAIRLMHLPLDEDSHGNLSQIAGAIWHSDFGWTQGACRALRDKLVRLMGGVHEPSNFAKSPDFGKSESFGNDKVGKGCQIHQTMTMYDELGNERQKAIAELRKLDGCSPLAYGFRDALAAAICVPRDGAPYDDKELCHLICDRLIHLLGGDEPTAMEYIQRIVREHDRRYLDVELSGAELSKKSIDAMSRRADQSHESSPMRQENETGITDELREWASTKPPYKHGKQLHVIADRIDEQAKTLEHDVEMWRDRAEDMRMERDELQAKLDSVTQEYLAMRSALDTSNTALRQILADRDEARKMLDKIQEIIDGEP